MLLPILFTCLKTVNYLIPLFKMFVRHYIIWPVQKASTSKSSLPKQSSLPPAPPLPVVTPIPRVDGDHRSFRVGLLNAMGFLVVPASCLALQDLKGLEFKFHVYKYILFIKADSNLQLCLLNTSFSGSRLQRSSTGWSRAWNWFCVLCHVFATAIKKWLHFTCVLQFIIVTIYHLNTNSTDRMFV